MLNKIKEKKNKEVIMSIQWIGIFNNLLSELLASNLNNKCERVYIKPTYLNKEASYSKFIWTCEFRFS